MAPRAAVVGTLAMGDVFHAALAALTRTRFDGRDGAPTRSEVAALLHEGSRV